MKYLTTLLLAAFILTGCNPSGKREAGSESAKSTGSAESAEMTAPAEFVLTKIWATDSTLLTCESVLYDKDRDRLYVACINGNPTDKDGNGYIALLNTDGSIEEMEWSTGLNAPKGMGVFGDRLYVTDIDEVVEIDVTSGEILRRIPVEGASFLNDISIDSNGDIYFSDSDTGIVWVYSDGTLNRWITEGLERPNGLYVEESRVLLTSSGSQDLKIIDKESGEYETVTTGIGAGDGVEFTGMEGHYLTSSWTGEVFLIFPDFSKKSLLKTSDQEINSADIGFNQSEQVVYVPTFFDNRVVAYRLEKE